MFYYQSTTPNVGQIVIGILMPERETTNCLYVRVPEYDNVEGLIPKSNLPKKKRVHRKILDQMKKDKLIICVINSEPTLDSGELNTLDLTLKNSIDDFKQALIERFYNIGRIHKLLTFLSEEIDIEFDVIAKGFRPYVVELDSEGLGVHDEYDEYDEYDDIEHNDIEHKKKEHTVRDIELSNLYQKILSNKKFLLDTLDLPDQQTQEIDAIMEHRTTITHPNYCIEFEFKIFNTDNTDIEPIDALQKTFEKILIDNPNITIKYNGAPLYTITTSEFMDPNIEFKPQFERINESFGAKANIEFQQPKAMGKTICTFAFSREIII